jgi:hypothetical protein
VIEVSYALDTQPPGRFGTPQVIDLSVIGPNNMETWSDFYNATTSRIQVAAAGGLEYQIILWYTFPKFAYQLRTSLTPAS